MLDRHSCTASSTGWTQNDPRDEHAAYVMAAWLQLAGNGSLASYFKPPLMTEERAVADIEGCILGLV